ncbi:hypothetical protein BHE74_00000905 [Ensete ventricosum]|nr:hypothetical protein BHE74_00000905 [Ensete ventricosum]
MEPVARRRVTEMNGHGHNGRKKDSRGDGCFQMPLHYPSYTKADYEAMPEWQLDRLLSEYGLSVAGDVTQKRRYAMGAFLWSTRREFHGARSNKNQQGSEMGGRVEPMARKLPEANGRLGKKHGSDEHYFRMPLHYPRYSKADYEAMPEWQLDRLLAEYGLPAMGDVAQKRSFAMGAFLWTHH